MAADLEFRAAYREASLQRSKLKVCSKFFVHSPV